MIIAGAVSRWPSSWHQYAVPRRLLALALALGACAPHDVRRDPLPPVAVPDAWRGATAGPVTDDGRWWRSLGDAELDRLIEEILAGNLQLRAAWARVRQARAVVRQVGSGRWPQLEATAQASRTRQRFEISEDMVFTPLVDSFQVSIAAGYELDLWKRLSSNQAAATLDALSLRDDAEAIATSLAAEAAEAWFDVVATKARQELLGEQQRINETYLELTQLRYRQSLATSIDVYQQRQQVLATRALLEQGEGVLAASAARLAVLRGGDPGDRRWIDAAPAVLPDPAPPPATGLPVDLLVRRPDVRAARRRAEAADHRVAAAIADRLPALRVGGSAGLNAGDLADLLDGRVFSVFAALAAPLFDGGRRKAEVERNRDVVDERLLQLGHALVVAVAEVDQALADEAHRRVALATLTERVELARQTLTEARAFYAEGLIDYLQVLTALSALQSLELATLQARRDLLSARIKLHRALGGSWTAGLVVPDRTARK